MPTKNEFKFDCPKCGQHILAARAWAGRQIHCPSCETQLTIPPPPEEGFKPASELSPRPDSTPAKNVKAVGVAPAVGKLNAAAPQSLRIAALTPAIKLELVRAVRSRIADKNAWLPGRIGGKHTYAAKRSGAEYVLLDVEHPEATCFSLIGAFLREFNRRQVTPLATGRSTMLDRELPDAIREVLLAGMTEEERERPENIPDEKSRPALTHPQCLAVLDVLTELYTDRLSHLRAERAKQKLGNVRLVDLITKLEKKSRIPAEDVATALYHELMEVRRRLERLENRMHPEK